MISRAQTIWLAALIVGDFLVGAVSYGLLPSRSPVHWNIEGQVDRYGAPWEVALAVPIGAAAMVALLLGLAKIPQVGIALQRSGAIYGRIVTTIVGAMVGIHALLLLRAFGKPIDVPLGATIVVGLLLAVLGNWMGKLRRNRVAGIRTPWTLKSDVVWERTHRIGGRLMVVLGLVIIVAALLLPPFATLALLMVGLLALAVWSFVYSWRIYQAVGGDKHLA
ncbi:MAG TPA: SdpI family protein [Pirellulales bacterium]|jgi:uncharacterized membrane protein|nr:SdpI family protein [Pirellulales bacterium]